MKIKKTILIVFTLYFCVSCNIFTKHSIKGHWMWIKDNNRNNQTGMTLIKDITFEEKKCRFDYFGYTMGGDYTVEGNYIYINVGGELGTLTMEITAKDTLEGENWIQGTFTKIE